MVGIYRTITARILRTRCGLRRLEFSVGVVAFWCYRYLSARLLALDREMENASLDLLNQLTRLPMRFVVEPSLDRPVFC